MKDFKWKKLPEVVEQPELSDHLYLDKKNFKEWKTQTSYLESLNHLAYHFIWISKEMAEIIRSYHTNPTH